MNNNPLRQYFRRPAIYLKLPSKGIGYPPGSLDFSETGELPVFPMTAIDELTSKTPDALYNGSAVPDIISSCIPAIKNPWDLRSDDLDAILVAIRIASSGGTMEIETECPSCNETSKFDLNLSQLLSTFNAGAYEKLLTIGDLKFKFHSLSYRDANKHSITQFELRRAFAQANIASLPEDEASKVNASMMQQINDQTISLMTDAIEYILVEDQKITDKDNIQEYLRNCDRKSFQVIRDTNIDMKKDSETKPLDIKCPACSHEYSQEFILNVSDFFDFDS
jgi:hypothetical protein